MAHRRERTIILAALFTALSVALGFLLAGIPNVELMTLTVFLAGLFCGARLGSACGAFSMALHSLLNPLGPAPPPLLVAQIAGFSLIGGAGALAKRWIAPLGARGAAASAIAGFLVTLAYDALTTLATAFVALGPSRIAEGLGGIVLAGALFVAWHVGINTAVFALAVVPLMRGVRAWQGGEVS
jgi:hypothetical protein